MKTLIALPSALAAAALLVAAAPAPSAPGAAAAAAQAAANVSITFRFEVGERAGKVLLSLHGSESSYRSGPATRTAEIDVAGGQSSVTFDNLPAGDYAMKAFHDVNGNGKMDTNPFGMPTEPYAFSNNAVGNFGPASWERAKFSAGQSVSQTIRLR